MILSDPEILCDVNALTVYSQAISNSALQLVSLTDKTTPEYSEANEYFKKYMPEFKSLVAKVESKLG